MIQTLHSFLRAPLRSRLTALLAGALLVAAFAPFQAWYIAPFLVAVLAFIWEQASPRDAAWTGFAFGFGLFAAGTWWLYISLNILGGLWPPLAILLMLMLVLIMACYFALTGYVTTKYSQCGGVLRWVVFFPAAWTVFEWLRGWLFTGFPWMSIGYSQTNSALGAIAPIGGVYGVTWITVLLAGALLTLLLGNLRQRGIALLSVVATLGVVWALNGIQWTRAQGEPLQVRLVQGAVPQDKKWLPSQLQPTLDLYTSLSASDTPLDLIVWPEAAVPALPFEVSDFLEDLHADMVARDTQMFVGILSLDLERDVFLNSLWSMGVEGGEYHKRHLVPFGEYFPVPDFVRKVMRMMNLPSENVSPGLPVQSPLFVKGVPVAPTICYEIAYGAEQLSFFPDAQLMVNVSNDAWFGDTLAPHQHLQINQFRARETGRPMLRVTNTGITAAIDEQGQVVERIPQFDPWCC